VLKPTKTATNTPIVGAENLRTPDRERPNLFMTTLSLEADRVAIIDPPNTRENRDMTPQEESERRKRKIRDHRPSDDVFESEESPERRTNAMSRRCAKRITLSALFLLVGISAISVVALRGVLVESWYIWRLSWKDLDTRREAIAALTEIGSKSTGAIDVVARHLRRTTAVLFIAKRPNEEPRGQLLTRPRYRDPRNRVVDPGTFPLTGAEVRTALLDYMTSNTPDSIRLTVPEATALLDTFDAEFFRTDGLRSLVVLPRRLYDFALPVMIAPYPERFARFGLLWDEIAEEF